MSEMALEMAAGGGLPAKIAPAGTDIVPPEFDPTSPVPGRPDISGGIGRFLGGPDIAERGMVPTTERIGEAMREGRPSAPAPAPTMMRMERTTGFAPSEARPLDLGTPPALAATRQAGVRSRAQTRARELEAQGKSREEILEIMNQEGFHVVP